MYTHNSSPGPAVSTALVTALTSHLEASYQHKPFILFDADPVLLQDDISISGRVIRLIACTVEQEPMLLNMALVYVPRCGQAGCCDPSHSVLARLAGSKIGSKVMGLGGRVLFWLGKLGVFFFFFFL